MSSTFERETSGIPNEDGMPRQGRPSASARKALEEEIRRVKLMSIEERVLAALSMPGRFTWVQQTRKIPNP